MTKTSSGVSGGNVWKPRLKPSTALSLMTPKEVTLEKKRKIFRRVLVIPSFIMSILFFVSTLIISNIVRDSYSSTKEYFSLPKISVLNSEVEGFHLVTILTIVSFIFWLVACSTLFFSSKDNIYLFLMIFYPGVMGTFVLLGGPILEVQNSVQFNTWLQETHELTAATRINIPAEDGLFDKETLTTNSEGEPVMVTLELKDLNIYVVKQELIEGN
jgi:hypothetical protein